MSARRSLSRRFNHYRSGRTRKRNRKVKVAKPPQHRLEALEPRVLLSTTYVITDLHVLDNTDSSYAADINNAGEIVGTSSRTGLAPQSRAFLWDAASGMQDLGTLGGTDAWASAINWSYLRSIPSGQLAVSLSTPTER